ncbi:MAG: hypothetical protein PHI59_07540 [Candidatus Omnitrophica bacterium]|nr:hypothetical protein [Candidatus Omnitrophota bacterium]
MKKITDFLPKTNVEKLALKTFIIIWIVTLFVTISLRAVKGNYDSIEKRISDMATKMRISPSVSPDEIKKYEALLNRIEYPETESVYAQKVKRDPFSAYTEEVIDATATTAEHVFSLRSIGHVPLPVMYKGYIELADKLIGQVSWKDATRFVEPGTSLNGYKIQRITKEKIDVIDEQGRKINFILNKPVLSDKLNAVLYDSISKKTFTVEMSGVIDDYKVIDIQPDYVILLSKGAQIKLTRE